MNITKTTGLLVFSALIFWSSPALTAGQAAISGGSCAQNACEAPPKIILTSLVGG